MLKWWASSDGEFLQIEYRKGRLKMGRIRANLAERRAAAIDNGVDSFIRGAIDWYLAGAEQGVLYKLVEGYGVRLDKVRMTDRINKRSLKSTMLHFVEGRLEESGWRIVSSPPP